MRTRIKWSVWICTPSNGLHMTILGSTFGDHQIVEVVYFVQVGASGAAPPVPVQINRLLVSLAPVLMSISH